MIDDFFIVDYVEVEFLVLLWDWVRIVDMLVWMFLIGVCDGVDCMVDLVFVVCDFVVISMVLNGWVV